MTEIRRNALQASESKVCFSMLSVVAMLNFNYINYPHNCNLHFDISYTLILTANKCGVLITFNKTFVLFSTKHLRHLHTTYDVNLLTFFTFIH